MPKILKKNTAVNYQVFLARFNEQFGERELQTITSEEILTFLTQLSENTRQTPT
jgi:site-specific recombinase XerD